MSDRMTPLLWCNQCNSFHRDGHGCPCLKKIADLESTIRMLRGGRADDATRIEHLTVDNRNLRARITELTTDRSRHDVDTIVPHGAYRVDPFNPE